MNLAFRAVLRIVVGGQRSLGGREIWHRLVGVSDCSGACSALVSCDDVEIHRVE